MIYKVSYVVLDRKHPGTIRNETKYPAVGDVVKIGRESFEVVEVLELLPPRGDFGYLHVTCRTLDSKQQRQSS
jgi:hypothetical protein